MGTQLLYHNNLCSIHMLHLLVAVLVLFPIALYYKLFNEHKYKSTFIVIYIYVFNINQWNKKCIWNFSRETI
jgi:hypothetical protein